MNLGQDKSYSFDNSFACDIEDENDKTLENIVVDQHAVAQTLKTSVGGV